MNNSFPEKVPFTYLLTEEGKQYSKALLDDPIIRNLDFVVKEDFLGEKFQLLIKKEKESFTLYYKGEELTDDFFMSEQINFFFLGITEESRVFILACEQLRKIIERSPNIDFALMLYLDVYGGPFTKRRMYSPNTTMSIYHIAIDGILCTQREVEILLDVVRKDIGLTQEEINMVASPIKFKGNLQDCINYSMGIEDIFGVTIYPENFITEKNILAMRMSYQGFSGKGKMRRDDEYEKVIELEKVFDEFINKEAIDAYDISLGRAKKQSSMYNRCKLFNKYAKEKLKEKYPDLYEDYMGLSEIYWEQLNTRIFKKAFHIYLRGQGDGNTFSD